MARSGAGSTARSEPVPPTRLLMIDIDLDVDKPWLRQYRSNVALMLKSCGLSPTAIRITRSRSKGYHARIYLNKPVPAETACMLQWILCDDAPRVDFNRARIKAGFDEWNKLFEPPKGRRDRCLDTLERTVEATLYSAYVKDEKPLSLLIVAKPESAKTLVLKKYRENKGIVYLTDCTAYGLIRDILPKVVSGEIRHILIADLITPLSKSAKTRQSLVAFLNNLIEEGVAKMTTYATVWEKEVRCGLVSAITDDALKDGRHEWAKMGFLSRMFIFSYSYPISAVYKIFDSLIEDKSGIDEKVKLRFPNHPKEIVVPKPIAEKLIPISMKVGESMKLSATSQSSFNPSRSMLSPSSQTITRALAAFQSSGMITSQV
jgi:hypothetical protein